MKQTFYTLIVFLVVMACQPKKDVTNENMEKISAFNVFQKHFGVLPEGDSVVQFIISNSNGMEVRILNYGGIVTHLMVPDKAGKVEDVVLGYDNLEGYLTLTPYFGALVGRYGNRIAKGKFTLDEVEYNLAINNGPNHLHGGIKGFDKVIWDAEVIENDDNIELKLSYLSKDMEEGYPGNLNAEVSYIIKESNEIMVVYKATTDKKTVVNLTQHSYFNLSGNSKKDILDHELEMRSSFLMPVDAGLIPTGNKMAVEGTPFDFTSPAIVGTRIDEDHDQIKLGGGYDHCMVLDKADSSALEWVVKATDKESGRVFELATTEPAVQFYSGNFLDGTITGKNGVVYNQRYGMCFEPEHYPDSPNQSNFPSTVLSPGETYNSTTVWRFRVVQ